MTDAPTNPKTDQEAIWDRLVKIGMANAISGLSTMVGQEIAATKLETRKHLIKDVPALLGGAETTAVGVMISIESHPGYIALVYQPNVAWNLVDILLDRPEGTTGAPDIYSLEELERSTLGEMGNVMGTFFLNAVADRTGYELRPTPPVVMMDMIGSIIDAALAEIMITADEIILVDAVFGTKDRQINGKFVVMPSPGLLADVMKAWGKAA